MDELERTRSILRWFHVMRIVSFSLRVGLVIRGDHSSFAYQSPLGIQVIRKVPNMHHGRVMSGPGLRNKPWKTGSPTDSAHVSINHKLRRPILQMVQKRN